ncbi:MAG: hypothetical protein AAF717_20610 [Bacteroidota bacterium]
MEFTLPANWMVKSNPKAPGKTFVSSNNSGMAILQVRIADLKSIQELMSKSSQKITTSIRIKFGNSFRLNTKKTEGGFIYYHFNEPSGNHIHMGCGTLPKQGIMILMVVPKNNQQNIKGFTELSEVFKSFEKKTDIKKVLARTKSTSNTIHKGSSSLLGQWHISNKNIDMTSGPFGIILAGAGSTWKVSPNVGNMNAWGSKLEYTFNSNGTYTGAYKSLSTFGIMQSMMDVTENGTFLVSGDNLTLYPKKYTGEGYIGNVSQKKKIVVDNLSKRSYKWGSNGINLVLYGVCGEFQIEPHCEKDNKIIVGFERR